MPGRALSANASSFADRALARHGFLLLLLPGLFFSVVFFALPVGLLLKRSFFDPGFTLGFYEEIFTNPAYLTSFWISLKIAFITTVFSMLASYPLAYAILIAPSAVRSIMLACVLLPLWTNILIRCYAWMLILQTNGFINTMLVSWLGVANEPIPLVFNLTGVIIGMTHYLIPINTLVILSVMTGIDLRLVSAAKGLGANPVRAFLHVFFPLSMPGVSASAILIFVVGLGFFVTPALLGGQRETNVSMLVSLYFTDVLNWGMGSALATVLMVLTVLLLFGYSFLQPDKMQSSLR
jgi:putative spermidine/putrescine transport system permease protein/spermidine/putrescine transport system permease protein